MAEGGRCNCESDFVHDFPCSPCEKGGLNVAGVKYCVDCDENFCLDCLKHHNRFSMGQGHTVSDQVQTCKGHVKQLPTKRCSKHGGKIIDLYCPKHDIVGCSTCMAVEHSSCGDIKFIPDVAAGIKTSTELEQLVTDIKTIKSKLDSLKEQKRMIVNRLKKDKDSLRKEIQNVRKQLNSQLDKMEKELLDEAEEKFEQKIEAINASIDDVDFTITQLEKTMTQIKTDDQDPDIFISCKIGKQELYPTVKEPANLLSERSFELLTDENAQLIMQGRMFAAIIDRYDIQDVEYKNDKNILLSDDKNICRVCSLCPLSDGCLVMSDHNNKCLKKLDTVSGNVSKLITLAGTPAGICLVEDTRLAVSLINRKKIQFVSLDNPVTLGHSFTVGEHCRGVAHSDGLLYVCCGGSPASVSIEGRGHIEVYNCYGDLLRCLYNEFKFPRHISVINDGNESMMYISDYYEGVQVRSMDGVIKHRFPTVLESDLPFCMIGSKHVFIGEYTTGKIYVHAGGDKRLLIDKKDLKCQPIALYVDVKSSKLYVSCIKCDVIKIYNI